MKAESGTKKHLEWLKRVLFLFKKRLFSPKKRPFFTQKWPFLPPKRRFLPPKRRFLAQKRRFLANNGCLFGSERPASCWIQVPEQFSAPKGVFFARFLLQNRHFLLQNRHFLLQNSHFLLQNSHFLLQNSHFLRLFLLDKGQVFPLIANCKWTHTLIVLSWRMPRFRNWTRSTLVVVRLHLVCHIWKHISNFHFCCGHTKWHTFVFSQLNVNVSSFESANFLNSSFPLLNVNWEENFLFWNSQSVWVMAM